MDKFTVDEIKAYLKAQDSFHAIHYNLSAENIRKANLNELTDTLKDFLSDFPQYKELKIGTDKYGSIFKQIELLLPFFSTSSLHVSEQRYLVEDEVYAVIYGISSEIGEAPMIQRLTNKDDCKHKTTHDFNHEITMCSRCGYEVTK